MSSQHSGRTPGDPPPETGVISWDRWSLGTIAVGVVLAAIHAVHINEMLYYGALGVIVEGVVPFILAGVLAMCGPWLAYRGYTGEERRKVFAWMVVFGVLVGLVFLWSLSHQYVVGGTFPHAEYVTTTNLTAGAMLGIVVGLYEVRTNRHYETAERERRRSELQRSRLSVLNRILRHNIRNDANLVHGICSDIATETDGGISTRAETAATVIDDLHSLSEKARRIDQTLDAEPHASAVDIEPLLGEVTEAYATSDPTVPLDVEVDPGTPPIRARKELLRGVVAELVENAVTHGGDDLSRVTVRACPSAGGGIDLRVEDDGPGIPTIEQESLTFGVERDIEHASGIGLWFAKWGTETLGGELTIESNDGDGTVVALWLPEAGERPAHPWAGS